MSRALPHSFLEALQLRERRRGRSRCARSLYALGRHDDGYVADAYLRRQDPEVRRYRQLVAA